MPSNFYPESLIRIVLRNFPHFQPNIPPSLGLLKFKHNILWFTRCNFCRSLPNSAVSPDKGGPLWYTDTVKEVIPLIKHVLFVKLKDNSPENCQELKDMFLSMKGRVPVIRGLQVGVDYLHSDRSYDVVLELLVDSPEALEAYQRDPYHAGVVKPFVAERRAASATVDYALDESE